MKELGTRVRCSTKITAASFVISAQFLMRYKKHLSKNAASNGTAFKNVSNTLIMHYMTYQKLEFAERQRVILKWEK